jgi:hypothetical protein
VNARLRTWLVRVPLALAVTVAIVWGPHLVWLARAARTANIVIVDKTVPFRNYREHAAFTWLLHALKVLAPSGRYYEEGRDYLGYDPIHHQGRAIGAADLEHADAVFIADTYGVYQGDYKRPGEVAALERSPKIYGGFEADEARAIDAFARRGGLTLAEFNALASPTEAGPRATLEALLGMRWTHWVARYWDNLGNDEEVPQWLRRDYLRRYGKELEHSGSALVFVREDEDIVVLRPGIDLKPDVLLMERTAAGDPSWPARARYVYWLDVVEATTGTIVYDYEVAATDAGARQLAEHGLPLRFPAVVHGVESSWYFAGDMIDTATEMGDPERAGLLRWRRELRGDIGGDGAVLWGFYFPILEDLLEPVLTRAPSKVAPRPH